MKIEHVFFITIVTVCLYRIGSWLRDAYSIIQASSWPSTDGELLGFDGTSEGVVKALSNGMQYRYFVDGKEYIGANVSFGLNGVSGTVSSIRKMYKIIPDLPKLRVYYDPNNPDLAYIVIGFPIYEILKSLWVLGILAIVCFVFYHLTFR